jgi:regulator of nucleoside diphosphate kinase
MFNTPQCCVTAKDFTILGNMIRRTPPYDDRLLRLLRRKLSMAIVVLPDDVAPDVATINSRVEYRIDGGRTEACVLVHEAGNASLGLALPISTLRGLALLGLSAGDSVAIERTDGRVETVSLETVAYQPESAKRGDGLAQSAGNGATLVNLRQYATSRTRGANSNAALEDDDHGPPAA